MRLIYLLFGSLLLGSCKNSLKEIDKNYGIGFNKERISRGITPIMDIMKLVEGVEGEQYLYVYHKEENAKHACYLHKALTIDKSTQKLTHEADVYLNPQENIYLVYDYEYGSDRTSIMLQERNKDKYSNSSHVIDSIQADSVLKAWKILLTTSDIPPHKGLF